jgi:hypothetical protein
MSLVVELDWSGESFQSVLGMPPIVNAVLKLVEIQRPESRHFSRLLRRFVGARSL